MKKIVLLLCLAAAPSAFAVSPIYGGGGGGGDALTTNPLSQFAATTSAQFKGVISDENAPDGASSKVIMALGSISIASGKTITFDHTSTFTTTDGQTYTFPVTSATLARTDAANTFTGAQSATSLATTGTAGAGFVEYPSQSSAPAAPATGFRVYADSTGRNSWIRASDGFTRAWDATLTANRVYTLPDATDTLVGKATTDVLTNKDLTSGTNTFPTLNQNTTGSAAKWTTARTLALTGDVTYTSPSLDGSGNVTAAAAVANIPVAATYASDLTAVPLNVGGWKEYFVTGSNFTTTNTTATTITGLTTDTLSNSTLYEIECVLLITADTDTAGMKFAWTGTNSPTGFLVDDGTTTAGAASTSTYNTAGTLGTARIGAASISGIDWFRGFITSGTSAATISMQVGKVTSGTATVKVGSVLRIRKAHP